MAVAAERLGHRADDPDLPGSVGIAVAGRHLPSVRGADLLQRPNGGDAGHDFAGRNDLRRRPVVRVAHIHELDEAQDVSPIAEILAQGDDLVVIDAALEHAVDLDGKAEGGGVVDAAQHARRLETLSVHAAGDGVVEGIDRDIEAVQPGLAQGGRGLFQEPAVSGQGDDGNPQLLLELAHQLRNVRPQQGLAPGQPHFLDPQGHECARDPHELAVGHELGRVQERVPGPKDLLWHAVGASEVAAVRHGNAQVPERAAERIAGGNGHSGDRDTR